MTFETIHSERVVLAGNAGALVERDDALRVLSERLKSAANGAGNTALVSGEAGIGKTSVFRALAAAHPHVRLWWGACDALQTPHPLAPLYDIARSADVRFGALLRADGNRAELFESVVAELRRSRVPTLMVVEDAHWADEATLDFLKFVGRRVESVPCLLAVSYRDDEVTATHPLRRLIGDLPSGTVTRVELPRLSSSAVDALARRALRTSGAIYEATGGNPFFVTELLRNPPSGTPRSIEDLVLARYARLSPAAQAIVNLTSIVPGKIERWLVEKLLPAGVLPLEQCLNSGLLEVDAVTLHFRHELARIVIEAALSEPASRALHGIVLEALVNGGRSHPSSARLAHHATRFGDDAAILRYAPEAARQAALRGAHREAISHYRAALGSAGARPDERAIWLEHYAYECAYTAALEEAVAAREEAAELHRSAANVVGEAENLSELALAYIRAMRNRDAEIASNRAVALLEARPPSIELARAYRVHAHLRFLNRECAEAIAWSGKAIHLAERFGATDVLAGALGTLGAATMFGDYEAGCEHLRRAFDLAESGGLDFMAAIVANNLGSGSGELYRFREAREYLLRATSFAQSRDIASARTYATSWLALCEMYLGRWDEAEKLSLDVIERSDDRTISRVYALVALGRVRARRGDSSGAAQMLDEALALSDASNTVQRTAIVRAARAEAAYLRGDVRATLAEASTALAVAASREDTWSAGELRYWMHRAGALELPAAHCAEPFALHIAGRDREAADAWNTLGCTYEHARALADGDVREQCEALRLFESLGALPDATNVRRRLRAAAVPGISRGPRASTKSHPGDLTDRELEVVALLCRGLKNAEIAEYLSRSVRTVDHHVAAVFAKFGVSTRSEAIVAASRLGIKP